jgi:hypothetical protein
MLHPTQSNAVRAILLPPTQFTTIGYVCNAVRAILLPLNPVTTVHTIGFASMDMTMAADGNTWAAPSCAPPCAPTKFLFEAVDDLSKMYLTGKWTGSIKFRCLPVSGLMVGLPLDKLSIKEVDICEYLGWSSSHPSVVRLYLDPGKYDKPPLHGEPLTKNSHWIQLKVALEAAAFTSGSPIMCNGGRDNRTFKCKLRNRVYKPKSGKKGGAPRQDDCINMDKGGRQLDGRSQSKRTRTTQALTTDQICPFTFNVKWDLVGFYITLQKISFGCPHHENHLKGDLSKLSLPMQLIPEKEKEIL